jgi:nicotinamide mononucleotide (NMN) deamidase PncC
MDLWSAPKRKPLSRRVSLVYFLAQNSFSRMAIKCSGIEGTSGKDKTPAGLFRAGVQFDRVDR